MGMIAFAATFSGCRSSNTGAGVLGSDDLLIGDPLDGDIVLVGDNAELPSDGDRSLFEPVFFAYDSSQVNPEQAHKVEEVARYIKRGSAQGVIVEGHADERGSREYNLALGERRALSVRDYLISLGVEPAAIQTRSLGEEMPSNPGHDDSAWRENRRAVFAIY